METIPTIPETRIRGIIVIAKCRKGNYELAKRIDSLIEQLDRISHEKAGAWVNLFKPLAGEKFSGKYFSTDGSVQREDFTVVIPVQLADLETFILDSIHGAIPRVLRRRRQSSLAHSILSPNLNDYVLA